MPNYMAPLPWMVETLGTYLPQARDMYSQIMSNNPTSDQRINEGRSYLQAARAENPDVRPLIMVVELFRKNADGSESVIDRFLGLQIGEKIYSFKDGRYVTRAGLQHDDVLMAKWYSTSEDPFLNMVSPWYVSSLKDMPLSLCGFIRKPPPEEVIPVKTSETSGVHTVAAGVGGEELAVPHVGTGVLKNTAAGRRTYSPQVEELQRLLNALGITDAQGRALEEDGKFGNRTEYATRALQQRLVAAGFSVGSNGADGKYGQMTEAALTACINAGRFDALKVPVSFVGPPAPTVQPEVSVMLASVTQPAGIGTMGEIELPGITLTLGDRGQVVVALKQALNEISGLIGLTCVLDTSGPDADLYDTDTSNAVRDLQQFFVDNGFTDNHMHMISANRNFDSATLEAWNRYNSLIQTNQLRGDLPGRGLTGARVQPGLVQLNNEMTHMQENMVVSDSVSLLMNNSPGSGAVSQSMANQLFALGEQSLKQNPPAWNESYTPRNVAERVYLEVMERRSEGAHNALIAARGARGLDNGCASYASTFLQHLYPNVNIPIVEGVVSMLDDGLLQGRYSATEGLSAGLLTEQPTNGGMMFYKYSDSGSTSSYSAHVMVTVLRDPDRDGQYQWYVYEDYASLTCTALAAHSKGGNAWYGRYPGT